MKAQLHMCRSEMPWACAARGIPGRMHRGCSQPSANKLWGRPRDIQSRQVVESSRRQRTWPALPAFPRCVSKQSQWVSMQGSGAGCWAT